MSGLSSTERAERVRDFTEGRGADIVVECTGVAEAIPEGLDMLRRGGMYIVAGVFADVGEVSINPHHIAARQARIIGMCNHLSTGCMASLKLLDKFKDLFPLHEFVTHKFRIDDADQAMRQAMDLDHSMKVVITP
jgi:threonine dehydrogenase-like Zn-dependent dehydrogenase